MNTEIKNYQEWLKFVFKHDVNEDYKKWIYLDKFMGPDIKKEELCDYIGKTFSDMNELLLNFSDTQITYGLNYIINPFISDASYSLLDIRVPNDKKIYSISKIINVFTIFFDKKCQPGKDYINYLCKMWWDLFPRHGVGRERDTLKEIDKKILCMLGEILSLSNPKCIESALHGLGHWHSGYPEEVESIISKNYEKLSDELKGYANQCRIGYIQ